MNEIKMARSNCAAVLSQYYSKYGLLADMLGSNGEYRAYWQTPDETVYESLCGNILDKNELIVINKLIRVDGKPKTKIPLS